VLSAIAAPLSVVVEAASDSVSIPDTTAAKITAALISASDRIVSIAIPKSSCPKLPASSAVVTAAARATLATANLPIRA
jgi:hypothetical protein